MELKEELSGRITKQHCLGCKVAMAFNILWAISNYFIITQNTWIYVSINIGVALLIFTTVMLRKKLKINGEILGLVAMLSTLSAFAFSYNTVDIGVFEKLTYMYVAMFIGAGMFLMWHIYYSLISVAYAFAINGLFYMLFSKIPLDYYLLNGGILVATIAAFMIIAIQVRYKLVVSDVISQIALEKSKNKLKKSEEQHRLLFEKNPTPMLICSLKSQKILAVNDFAIKKYGYNYQEFTSLKIQALHKEKDLKKLDLAIKKSTSGNDVFSEWTHVLKDKSEIEVELHGTSIIYNNEEARLVSINDVTNTKKHEQVLIDARQAAEKSKELQSEFLSNMSHEIRTPMNGILGITRVLQKTEMNDEQKHYLNAIIKSSENLMVIINDILDFSKIDAGKIVIEKTRFNLQELIQIVQEILVVKAEEKEIYLTINIDDNVPKWLNGDPVRLNQILINLVGNAIKFTEKGGVNITIKKTNDNEDISSLEFIVKDSGVGIPEDKISSIFESFTQASSSTTRTHGGTGLGLTISKQLIELQGGQIWINSVFGSGSEFCFNLDFENTLQNIENELHNEIEEKKSNDKILEELKGINILLVEDHPINQMLAMKVLGDWGFNVDLAENGLISLAKVAEKDYDLILMDISMPEMDGYTATREIRSGKHTSNNNLPIIAMTASALIGENQKCFKAGMNDYISKPFEPQNLLNKISNHVTINLKRA